jgi:hypothetical protein
MATAARDAQEAVRVHETPHQIHVEIELDAAEAEPQVLVGLTPHGVDVRVFRTPAHDATGRPNPDATPI